MNQDLFKIAEGRLWSEMVREGVVERYALEDGLRIRKAFRAALEDVKTPGEMMAAVAEILAISLSEMESRRRLTAALQARVWSGLLARLPREDRETVEQDLRTWTLKDIAL
jgi:hypothetical protein